MEQTSYDLASTANVAFECHRPYPNSMVMIYGGSITYTLYKNNNIFFFSNYSNDLFSGSFDKMLQYLITQREIGILDAYDEDED